MKVGHAVGQRGTFLSSFLISAGTRTSENVAFSMSDSSIIQHIYRGQADQEIENIWKEKAKTEADAKILLTFWKSQVNSVKACKTIRAILNFYLLMFDI